VLFISSMLSAPWLRQDQFLIAGIVFAAPVWVVAGLLKWWVLPKPQ
jgi:uncharacterized SAM-binding protein YcdF (DUF218 family)